MSMSPHEEETPEAIFDALNDAADDRIRDRLLDRLVAKFPPEALAEAVRPRLRHLDRPEGEAVLRIVESLDDPSLFDDLAAALKALPDLPPDRAWLALAILDGAGRLADPALLDWWGELDEAAGDEGTIDELAAQIEEDPDQLWVALQAMGSIEPEVRSEIVGGLARRAAGPAVLEFLRLLSFAHDPATREAALDALGEQPTSNESAALAWAEIAASHPDPEVIERARGWIGTSSPSSAATALAVREAPRLLKSVVTAIDGDGRGTVALLAGHSDRYVAASFLCDVLTGIVEVAGHDGADADAVSAPLDELVSSTFAAVVEQAHELALGLLSGSILLCRAEATPALRYWLERTAGRGFRPGPFGGLQGDWDPATFRFEEVAGASSRIIDACEDWIDRSDLTRDLAEAIALRDGQAEPDPARDAGAYRFLFEHRLHARLELYRRMLLWMSSFWIARGDAPLGRAALAISWQLADPAHAVPCHPFTVELTTRSLAAAMQESRGEPPSAR